MPILRTLDGEHLLTACNFTDQEQEVRLPEEMAGQKAQLLVGNCEGAKWGGTLKLQPYEAVVWNWKEG